MAEEFIEKYYLWNNNIRMPANKGHTPVELCKLYNIDSEPISISPSDYLAKQDEKKSLQDKRISEIIVSDLSPENKFILLNMLSKKTKKDIPKNAPCPCGSGKNTNAAVGNALTE